MLQNNDEDLRLNKTKVSRKCETLKGKVLSIKDKFKGFDQNKKIKGKSSVERKLMEWRKNNEKRRIYILLLYNEAYFNANEIGFYIPSVCVSLLQEFKDNEYSSPFFKKVVHLHGVPWSIVFDLSFWATSKRFCRVS